MDAQQHSLSRWWRHLTMTRWAMQRAFPPATLDAITAQVRASESMHGGEIRVAMEADLPLSLLWRQHSPRARAEHVFASLRVWDTQARNGVLIYLCLADHAVEIVADRGFSERISADEWSSVSRALQSACADGRFREGMCTAVELTGRLIAQHYPQVDRNEQDDRPVLL